MQYDKSNLTVNKLYKRCGAGREAVFCDTIHSMSLMIRFANKGKRGERKYDLVVIEKRERREGRPVETLGFYEKLVGGKVTKTINQERVDYWKSKGAQLSVGAKKILETN